MKITTEKELRKAFWRDHPTLPRRKITNYSGNGRMYRTDTRCAWSDYKAALSADGVISQELADRATLG